MGFWLGFWIVGYLLICIALENVHFDLELFFWITFVIWMLSE